MIDPARAYSLTGTWIRHIVSKYPSPPMQASKRCVNNSFEPPPIELTWGWRNVRTCLIGILGRFRTSSPHGGVHMSRCVEAESPHALRKAKERVRFCSFIPGALVVPDESVTQRHVHEILGWTLA